MTMPDSRLVCTFIALSAALLSLGFQPQGKDVPQTTPWNAPIRHSAVAENPLPRERTTVGIGEEIELQTEQPPGFGSEALVSWYVEGAAGDVYPLVSTQTIVKVALLAQDGTLSARAQVHRTAKKASPPAKADSEKLVEWVRNQSEALPKGNAGPIGQVPPTSEPFRPELATALQQLDHLRNGRETAFDKLDALGKKLLEDCRDARERGQVYYALAHIHAQSGLVHPEAVEEYASKALQCPLEPLQTPRLFVYWGDARQIARLHEPRSDRRKWSAILYLAGLADVLRYPLPAKAPRLPGVDAGGDRHEEQMAARRLAEFEIAMIQHRDTTLRQLASLYGNDSVALEELRILASAVLRNARAEESLMRRVRGGDWEN